MPQPDFLLSFSTDADGSQVFIHADAAGLEHLITSLERLLRKLGEGVSGHDHMMTDAWGGDELSQRHLGADERPVDHIKIYAWTEEQAQQHHLKA